MSTDSIRDSVVTLFPANSNHARRQLPGIFDFAIAKAADVHLHFAKPPIGFDSDLA